MGYLVQTEIPTVPRNSTQVRFSRFWLLGLLGALLLWLYWPTLIHLVEGWLDPDFSFGFVIPIFSAYVIWQERDRLGRILPEPSWSGLIPLGIGLVVLIVGRMGAELFLERSSLLLVLAGLIIVFAGWKLFRAVWFPWAFLLMMIPLPTLILNRVTFPLQLLASQVAAAVLPIFGVPVLREGNVITLPAMQLAVAEACSGIRSLMSLLALAIIYGYIVEKRTWVRWLLALAAIPITVLANDVRIVGTGLLVQYWDPAAAEGYYHAWWGLIIFVVSLVMLYALHAVVCRVFPEKVFPDPDPEAKKTIAPVASRGGAAPQIAPDSAPRFIVIALLVAVAAVFLQSHAGGEVFPPRLPLKQFPTQLGGWTATGTDEIIDKEQLDVLKPSDYLLRVYQNPQKDQYIDLFIPFYRSQRAGESTHSPQHCLPGNGWTPVDNHRITISVPGHAPFPVNRYLIARGDSRQLVLYWFWAHDRGVASEYWAKYYLVTDSIKLHRSDGSLVRISTPVYSDETVDAAQQRMMPFLRDVVPLLNSYIPR